MDKPIIIIKSTRHRSPETLDCMRKVIKRQMTDTGLILLPHDFEFTVVNADELDCFIEVISDDSKQGKEVKKWARFFQKVFCRKNKA